MPRRRARTDGWRSIRAWRAGCRITPARLSKSPCPTSPEALGGGGRYDNLVGMFSEPERAGGGFSLGLERIIVVDDRARHVPGGAR